MDVGWRRLRVAADRVRSVGGPRVDRLTADDRLILSVDAAWPQDVGALAILAGDVLTDAHGGVRLEAVRAAIAGRLDRVPRFRQRIVVPRRGLGGPFWRDVRHFDIAQHIAVHALPAGSDEPELLEAVESLRSRRLDPRRPLWEIWLLPGLSDGRVGLFLRMHHCVGDGRAAMTMVAAVLDRVPGPAATAGPAAAAATSAWTPAPAPTWQHLFVDNVICHVRSVGQSLAVLARPVSAVGRLAGTLPETRELLAERPGSETSLHRVIGPRRRHALVRGRLTELRRVAREHDATLNDVLLSATAAGLRSVLLARGEPVDGVTMRVYVPVSLRGRLHGTVQGNRISQMAVPLSLDEAEAGTRLRRIAAETVRRKARARTSFTPLFGIGFIRRWVLKAIIRQRVNVTTASLTGPRRRLYLAGAEVLEMFPFVNLIGNQPLGVGALSYAGALEIGVVADADACPDLAIFARAAEEELDRLARIGRPSASDKLPAVALRSSSPIVGEVRRAVVAPGR